MKKDNSPVVFQRSKLKGLLNIRNNIQLTIKQKQFFELALDKKTKIIFVSGPAGTAKTYCAIKCALELINKKSVSDLVYVRSVVESADSELGALPGEICDKISPYLQPLIDKLDELLPKEEIEILHKEKRISGIPINFLRGLSFNAKVITLDEAQNVSYREMFTFITRIGEFCKVFILGDPSQSDINGKSGFTKMMNIFDDQESRDNGIFVFKFDEEDIVRSQLVRFIFRKTKLITQSF